MEKTRKLIEVSWRIRGERKKEFLRNHGFKIKEELKIRNLDTQAP